MKYIALLLIAAVCIASTFTGGTFTGGSINTTGFIDLASSDLSGFSTQIETYYRDMPPDTSGWTVVDATNVSETNWNANQSANCIQATPHTSDATDDDGAAIGCLWDNADAEMVIYLPAGEYDHDSSGVMITPDTGDNDKVLRGAGPGLVGDLTGATIINLTRTDGIVQRALGAGANDVFGTATNWTAGHSGGTQILTVASTANINVPGWVYLTAAQESWSDDAPFYHTRVVCKDGTTGSDCSGVSTGQIKIDRGLPYSRDWSDSAQVQSWTPSVERVGVEDLAIQFTDPLTLAPQPCGANGSESNAIHMAEMAESWVDNVQFVNGWKRIMYFDKSARMSLRNSAFASQHFSKAFDHEMIQVLNTSDTLVEANYFRQAGEAVTHGSGIRAVFAYNVIDDPEDNQGDVDTTLGTSENYTKPDASLCTASEVPWSCCTGSGAGAGCGAAYCDDSRGTGTASNRIGETNRIDTCTTSLFLHNQSSHAVLFERNTFQCPTIVDHNNVPGGWVTWFGNRGEEDGGADNWSAADTADRAGSFFIQGSGLGSGVYRENWGYLNNHMNELGVTVANTQSKGWFASDNVIRDSCVLDETNGGTGATDCTNTAGDNVVGTPAHVFSNNDVGSLTKTGGRTMPTSLYMTESEWNAFVTEQGGTGTAPWVGADMDTFTGGSRPYTSPSTCLPAEEKWLGSCVTGAD